MALAEQRLRTRLDAALRRVYGVRGFESALSEERAAMMREVRDQLRPDATSLGLEIEDVRIRRTDLTQEVSQQTFDRMKAERLAEAERLRARGREAAQRIRARADREVVEIVAEARKESEILRGEGEAERNAIFADAFQRDPDFFEFYRSMIAYAQRAAGHRHDHGAVARLGVLPLLPQPERRAAPAAPAAERRDAARRNRSRRDACSRRTAPTTSVSGAACRISWPPWAWSSSSRAWSMAAFPGWRSGLRPRSCDARKRAEHRRTGGDRGGRRHRLAGARVTEDLFWRDMAKAANTPYFLPT